MSCPSWCMQDHSRPGSSASLHEATVAWGDGAGGSRIGVSVYRYGGQRAQVVLQVYGQTAGAAPSWTQPLSLQPDDAVAFAGVLPALGGPRWLADALTAAAERVGDQSAAAGAAPATGPVARPATDLEQARDLARAALDHVDAALSSARGLQNSLADDA